MFMVSEAEALAVREAWLTGGEAAASQALRGLFAGLPDNAETRASAVAIAGWVAPPKVISPRISRPSQTRSRGRC